MGVVVVDVNEQVLERGRARLLQLLVSGITLRNRFF